MEYAVIRPQFTDEQIDDTVTAVRACLDESKTVTIWVRFTGAQFESMDETGPATIERFLTALGPYTPKKEVCRTGRRYCVVIQP